MKWWPFKRRHDGYSAMLYCAPEPVRNPDLDIPNRLAESCIAHLTRENAELRAQIRSLRTSKGNLTKKLNRERAARMTGA